MKTLDSFLTKLRNRKPAGVTTAVNTVPIAVAKMKSDALSTDQEKILDKYVNQHDSVKCLVQRRCPHLRGNFVHNCMYTCSWDHAYCPD